MSADNIEKRPTKNGGFRYRVRVEIKGHKRLSATFTTLTKARLWKQQTETAIKDGKYFKIAEAKKHTVKELIERYEKDVLPKKTRAKQEQHFRWWKERIGHILLSDLSPPLIAKCRDELLVGTTPRGTKRSETTVLRYMSSFSHALSLAVREWHWLDDSPMRKVSKPKAARGRVRFLSPDERQRLLEACKNSICPYLYTIVVLALATGMRQGEILNLKWNDIDFEKNRIILHETKNGERRGVPLRGHALEVIKTLHSNRKNISPLLFPSNRLSSCKPYYIRSSWEKAIQVAEIKDYKFHDNRHSCASELLADGATLAQIAEILGHKTLQMVKRYAHLSEGNIGNALERLDKRVFGGVA